MLLSYRSLLATRVTMYWDDEKDRVLMRKMALCGIFQHKSAIWERGQFWQEIATNRNNYRDFSVILLAFWDQFTTILRKYNNYTWKEIRGIEHRGEEKTEYKTIYDTCTFLIQKKLRQWRKRHLKLWQQRDSNPQLLSSSTSTQCFSQTG